ncbi:MAG: CopG family transcriptional regulator [Candidatus Saliniplasma sp.]
MSTDSKKRSKRVNFRLPEELVDMADVTARVKHKNRTDILKEALDEHLHEIIDEEFKQRVIELYLDDEIEYEMLKKFLGREDAEAVKSSKDILDRGDELAEELSKL